MEKEKKTIVSIKVDQNMLNMVDAIKNKLSYKSRASVLEEALRIMFKKNFPKIYYKGNSN